MSDYSYELHETLLRVENVSLTLGGNLILRDVNLEIKDIVRPDCSQGQVVGLLGPSGIGKTRLFRIMAGLDKPDTGQVLINSTGVPVHRGMVGVVAQHYPLFEHRTILSNLLVAGKQAGLKGDAAREKAETMCKRFGIGNHLHKFPAQLSGGQRQRAAIAQQFMCSEHFLLMDEPFSGLDLVAKQAVSEFIAEVAAADELNTIIVVTHDIAAAAEVADTLWLLGRDRDAKGEIIPGSRIQMTYNLIERGLAWRKDIVHSPEYFTLLQEIYTVFPKL